MSHKGIFATCSQSERCCLEFQERWPAWRFLCSLRAPKFHVAWWPRHWSFRGTLFLGLYHVTKGLKGHPFSQTDIPLAFTENTVLTFQKHASSAGEQTNVSAITVHPYQRKREARVHFPRLHQKPIRTYFSRDWNLHNSLSPLLLSDWHMVMARELAKSWNIET